MVEADSRTSVGLLTGDARCMVFLLQHLRPAVLLCDRGESLSRRSISRMNAQDPLYTLELYRVSREMEGENTRIAPTTRAGPKPGQAPICLTAGRRPSRGCGSHPARPREFLSSCSQMGQASEITLERCGSLQDSPFRLYYMRYRSPCWQRQNHASMLSQISVLQIEHTIASRSVIEIGYDSRGFLLKEGPRRPRKSDTRSLQYRDLGNR